MKIRLSKEIVRNEFVKKVEELIGVNILSCYQCGKCSAGCPSSFFMDLIPSHIIRLIQLGQKEEVLNSKTMWLCASCLTCSVRCPRGVDIAAIMETLRLLKTREMVNYVEPNKIPKEELEELPQIALISNFRKFTG